MIKRITAFLLSVCLIIVAVPVYAGAATEQRITVYASSTVAGGTAYVTLTAENFENIAALDVSLHYDPSVFTVSHTYNGYIFNYMLSDSQVSVNTAQAGEVKLSAMSLNGISGYGDLFTVIFDVKADCPPGSYPIDVSIGRVHNTRLETVSMDGVNGSVRIDEQIDNENETFYIYADRNANQLRKDETVCIDVYSSMGQSFVSTELVVEYDPEKFAFESVVLDPSLTEEGAIYSINSSMQGQVRIAYANDDPVSSYHLFELRLTSIVNEDTTTQVKIRATNVYRDDLTAYLPHEWNDTIHLAKLYEYDLSPKVFLQTEPLIVGKQSKSVFYLEKGAGVAAADFFVYYDPNIIRCVGVTKSEDAAMQNAMVITSDKYSNGTIRFSYIHMDADSSKDLPIVEILWEPLQTTYSHGSIAPNGVGVVDMEQNAISLEYVIDSNCIFETKEVKPTCTQAGSIADVCACGKKAREETIPALGHDLKTLKGYAASCTKTGMTDGQQCRVCNAVTTPQQIIPATGHQDKNKDSRCDVCGSVVCVTHKEEKIPGKAATCTANGLTEGKQCRVCGEILLAQKNIPATGHTEVTDPAYDATCTTEGKTEGKHCSACGEVFIAQQEIPPFGHSYQNGYCTRCGSEEYYEPGNNSAATVYGNHFYYLYYSPANWSEAKAACERVGGHLVTLTNATEDQAISRFFANRGYLWLGARLNSENRWTWVTGETWNYTHWDIGEPSGGGENCGLLVPNGWNDVVDEYTLQSGYICEWDSLADVPDDVLSAYFDCGCTYGDTYVTKAVQEATCITRGSVQIYCCNCGVILEAIDIPVADHQWQETTCSEPRRCTVCGITDGVTAEHQYNQWHVIIEPTCRQPGQEESCCSVCGSAIAYRTIPTTNHQWKDATCTQPRTCTFCGLTDGTVLSHTEVVDKAVAATCTASGKTEGKHCSVCGAVTKAQQTVPAKGHTVVMDKAVAATCTAAGKTVGKHCSVCNTVLVAQQTVPAIGHSWVDATCTAAKTCKTCGATSGNAKGHDWKAGNCTTPKTCKVCGAKDGGVVHTYDSQYDYKCNVCKATRTVDMTRPMVDMFRMYDPNSGEHFYTGSMEERENLVAVGWNYEGVGFTFPLTTGDPVHRLYDPVTGEHLYTMDVTEKNVLLAAGWNYEGIAFNSGFENEVPQYRLHNPNATRGAYHFTASLEERDMLISLGWEYQGIGWYSLGA